MQISTSGSNAGADASYSHVNGLRQGRNNSTLDCIDVNDAVAPRLGLSMTANSSDSVEEFRELTAGGKAEYGRNAGGQVELITRSGTNEYHFTAPMLTSPGSRKAVDPAHLQRFRARPQFPGE